MTESTCVLGHKVVVAFLPWGHVLGHSAGEGVLSLLDKGVFILKALLNLFETSVVLLVLAEDFGVLGHVLFIGQPSLISFTLGVVGVTDVVINCTNVVVINSVLDVVEVVVSHGNTVLGNLVLGLVHGVSADILNQLISAFNNLSERTFGLLRVNLRKLLHLQMMFTNQMFFLLSQISKITSR